MEDDLTVVEWLQKEKLNDKEIDFILTFFPAISTLLADKKKESDIYTMLHNHFPNFLIDKNKNYFQFKNVDIMIQENIKVKFSTKELLKRMSKQGFCKPVSELILTTV